MIQEFNTGFREWKPGKLHLPKVEIHSYGFTFVIEDFDGKTFLELLMEAANEIFVLPIPEPFKTKQAAMDYIHAVSAAFVPDDCVVEVCEGDTLIETLTKESLKGEVQ